ncbi:sensor domain-containing protein [Roseofilum casamattae]|uniref:EAL domain-containing protein n=1 Tax=Roseofilum casamattae BLCC-M143 TaxID=3022442 RepID=A0ABT7BX00_9CYAN|nr:GGDEF domain-containing phosphodiesterase [Roseofilum casamattae]MDJ1183723.1 EAL domain-containing protein [Roseofilum casamattae BLCC-M143]
MKTPRNPSQLVRAIATLTAQRLPWSSLLQRLREKGFWVGLSLTAILASCGLAYGLVFARVNSPVLPISLVPILSVSFLLAIAAIVHYFQDKNNALGAELDRTQTSLAKSLAQVTSLNVLLQELLRESQTYYQSLTDLLPQSLYHVDREGKLTFVNKAFLESIEQSWDDVIGKTLSDIYPQELADLYQAEDRAVLETQESVDRIAGQQFINSDRLRYFHIIKTPIANSKNEAIGTQAIFLDITERETILEQLQQSQQRYELAAQAGRVGLWEWDFQQNMLHLDGSLETLLGYPVGEEEYSLNDWKQMIYPEDRATILETIEQIIRRGRKQCEIVHRCVDSDGKIRWFLLRGTVQFDPENRPLRLMGTGTEITELKETEQALIQAQEKYHSIFANAIEGIYQTTLDGQWISINPAFARILGYQSPEQLMAVVDNISEQLFVRPGKREELIARLEKDNEINGFEYEVYRLDRSQIWISENSHCVRDREGNILYLEGTIEDITQRKKAQEILEYHAFHDPLTGLLNRTALIERISEYLALARQDLGKLFAVLLIDLNRFKIVNDSLGHFVGDQLLISVARRLESYVEKSGIVSRLNSDEFAVLIPEIRSYDEVLELAECMEDAMANEPFWVQSHEVFITASIGIALSHHESTGLVYEEAERLLRDADTARYHAKQKGRIHHQLFDSTMRGMDECQFQLEMDLRRAIERNEFCLYYQPIICLKTGKIVSFESLIRWKNSDNTIVSPVKFIPIAEVTGLIVPIGEWVIEEACRQIQLWYADGLIADSLCVNVNVSGRQFSQTGLVGIVNDALNKYELNPHHLRVEITEGLMMENIESVVDQLFQLQHLGVRLCIDDFGTGHSSLSRLQVFPIDTLKIDRSFIPLNSDLDKDWELVKSIINLGHSLSMHVVAEGVETTEQQEKLQQLGCDFGQGYLYSRPLDCDGAIALLQTDKAGES